MALPHAEGYTNTAAGIVSFIYGQWGAARQNRLAILRVVFPDARDVYTLPKNPGLVQWTDGIASYRLLPFVSRVGSQLSRRDVKARFQVLCPECSGQRWFSIGKFMLHAPVHSRKASAETAHVRAEEA